MIFADPPDNLGLEYEGYIDKISLTEYYNKMELLIDWSLKKAPVFLLSYFWKHDLEIKYIVRNLLKYKYPSFQNKMFIWRYTFGQYRSTDCGSGFRYILRLMQNGTIIYPNNIRIESERQRLGDNRADSDGRVPDDVWDIPRVTGNSRERRSWHPTQHPESLMERLILLHTKEGDKIFDPFLGSGTTLIVGKRLKRIVSGCEISTHYCEKIGEKS